MSDEKFYKTTLSFVVLSSEPIPDAMELNTIISECDDGGYVLHSVPPLVEEILDRADIDAALIEAGSDPSFFSEWGDEGNFDAD